jgi:hypothetical protein
MIIQDDNWNQSVSVFILFKKKRQFLSFKNKKNYFIIMRTKFSKKTKSYENEALLKERIFKSITSNEFLPRYRQCSELFMVFVVELKRYLY